MPLFIIERRFADALDLDAEGAALIKQVNDAAGVNWLYSFLSADRRKTYCLYEAPNVEAIREAARLAGLPKSVTSRAEEILTMLEAEAPDAAATARAEQAEGRAAKAEPAAQDMGSLFASSLSDTLLSLDVMTMTPLEAMNELYRLQEQAKREAGKA